MKRFIYSVVGFGLLLLSIFFLYSFFMSNDSAPSKSMGEKTVNAYDLKMFGRIESSYLYTPVNYVFYNNQRIYIVDRSFGSNHVDSEEYAVINTGVELTAAERTAVMQQESRKSAEEIEFKSKHKVQIYNKGKVVREEWLLKAILFSDDEKHLSFIPLNNLNSLGFNLYAEGAEQFSDF